MKNLELYLLLLLIFSCSHDDTNNTEHENTENLGEKVFSIQFPNNLVTNKRKFHVILSDDSGNYLDSKTYNGIEETINLYSKEVFNENTSFTLTFITIFDNITYSLRVYSNITKSALGENILLKPMGFAVSSLQLNIPTTNLNNSILNAKGHGYSMVRINDKLSGHYTSKFNEDIGSENVFIKYYDPNDIINDHYKYILTNNIDNFSGLNENDLTSDHVEFKQITTNVPEELPLLIMYGYDNEQLFNNISGHQIYDTYIPAFGFGGNHYYSYPNIFYKTAYSLSFSSYSISGQGNPPSSVEVPSKTISSTLTNKQLTFSGIDGYEVGRVILDNFDLRINVQLVFDGKSQNVVIPTIPSGILNEKIRNALNNGQLRLVQAVAEDNHSLENYSDYLENVFKNSTPFYIVSPTRERIYKSYISNQPLPIGEFPYFGSFR